MGGAIPAIQDGSTNHQLHSTRAANAGLDLLIDLSNVEEDPTRLQKHYHSLISLNAVNYEAPCASLSRKGRIPSFDLLSSSCRLGSQSVQSENSSFYYDGSSDFVNDDPGLQIWKPLEPALESRKSSSEEIKSDLQNFCTVERYTSRKRRSVEIDEDSDPDSEEDLIDLSSDFGSARSRSTLDPQSPKTPARASIPQFGEAFSPCSTKVEKLDSRLRPSQRPKSSSTPLARFWTADRLTSPRRPPMASRESFIMSRPVSQLTPSQRVYRRRTGRSDPFESPHIRLSRSLHRNLPFIERGGNSNGHLRATRVLGLRRDTAPMTNRQVSSGNVWSVGGAVSAPNLYASQREGSRSLGGPRTHGRVHISKFLQGSAPGEDKDMHEKRLALALDVDQAEKVLSGPSYESTIAVGSVAITKQSTRYSAKCTNTPQTGATRLVWRDNQWMRADRTLRTRVALISMDPADDWLCRRKPKGWKTQARAYYTFQISQISCISRTLLTHRTVLEAPLLRDDFYCSVLAYSHRANRLAVALGFKVYLWSEENGTVELPSALDVTPLRSAYVTSLAFSSEAGGRAILAVGRGDGRIMMWSPIDSEPRFLRLRTSTTAAHLSFRPSIVRRPSQRHSALMADNEVFLVGDDLGIVSVYFVEWPDDSKRFLFGWHGSVCIHARVSIHTQQICGISWSANGDFFATGGNDNLCCLFQTSTILRTADRSIPPAFTELRRDWHGNTHLEMVTNGPTAIIIRSEHVKHQWKLNAAVKAIAFCPWQPGLLAAGGGSNDRCIHFYHTFSGACLATIDCAAQVTSLVWSTTRREIAATFGFAQPEHPYRVAVYAWPSCEQIVAIPWMSEMRALHAIAYPGRPDYGDRSSGGAVRASRGAEEGCIVIAGSDGSIKFHEIWSEERKATAPRHGLLGGSDILESLHGIEKEGRETIR